MPVLVTGVDGFIGSHLAAHLGAEGLDVIGIGRQPQLAGQPKQTRITYVQHDLRTNLASVPQIGRPDTIVHCAGEMLRPGTSVHSLVENNVLATMQLLRFAEGAGIKRFIYFSTVSIHGEVRESLYAPGTSIHNPTTYGLTKFLCELLIAEAHRIPMRLSLRLPGVLAPGAIIHWLALITDAAMKNEPIRYFNPDGLFNNAVHMSDVVKFVRQLVDLQWTGYDALPMGSATPMRLGEIVDWVVVNLGSRSSVEARQGERPAVPIDNSRAEKVYGYRPMGMRQALNLYLDALVTARENRAICSG